MFEHIYYACMCVCICSMNTHGILGMEYDEVRLPLTRVSQRYEMPYECWKLDSCSLKEQSVLLKTKPSL